MTALNVCFCASRIFVKREFFLLSWLLPVKKTKFQEKALCIFPVVLKINCGKMSWNILGQKHAWDEYDGAGINNI